MEGINQENQSHEALHGIAPQEPTHDERAIQLGITAAEAEQREIDDATARLIASQLHGGQEGALYALASSGHIDEERVYHELGEGFEQQSDPYIREWINWLGSYCIRREHKGFVEGWRELTADRDDDPPQDDDEEQARQALMSRISAAGVTTLGQVATIHTAEDVFGPDNRPSEPDAFPWSDAAQWRGDGGPDELSGGVDSAALEELFTRSLEEQFGWREEMGWCGLLRHDGRPGGVILRENQYGRRTAWVTDSGEELEDRWQEALREHDAFKLATRTRDGESAGRNDSPQIWVGSLADYTAGYLHGAWLDATLDPEELHAAVQFILKNSHELDAEEFGIFDYNGFGDGVSTLLGEYSSLTTVVKIAQGIEEHGQAYAAWAAYVGPEHTEQLDQFEDHFLGEWDSMEAYAEGLLIESEANRIIEEAPEWIKPYISVDTRAFARDLGVELYAVETPRGGVWVFDTRD